MLETDSLAKAMAIVETQDAHAEALCLSFRANSMAMTIPGQSWMADSYVTLHDRCILLRRKLPPDEWNNLVHALSHSQPGDLLAHHQH